MVNSYRGEDFDVANCSPNISNLPYAAALGEGRLAVRGICTGGTPFSNYDGLPVLQYGESTRSGNIECYSEMTGMTCLDVNSGTGFTIAKAGITMIGGDGTIYG